MKGLATRLIPEAKHGPISVKHGEALIKQDSLQLVRIRLLQWRSRIHGRVNRLVVHASRLIIMLQ
jgi:hypothetical protein